MAYRDTTAENREYWKNEMGQALREIHQVYDDKLDGMRNELETYYNLKVWFGLYRTLLICDVAKCCNVIIVHRGSHVNNHQLFILWIVSYK